MAEPPAGDSGKMTATPDKYPPVVRLLLAGTVLVVMVRAMSLPFLAIYLSRTLQVDPATIGLVIGSGALLGTVAGFFGGWLSDRIGRSGVLLSALLMSSLAFMALALANTLMQVMLAYLVISVAAAFYEPVSKALLSDMLPPAKRLKAFGHRYMAVNIGFALGPPLGAYSGLVESASTFVLTGAVYLVFCAALYVVMRAANDSTAPHSGRSNPVELSQALRTLARDRRLILFTFGSTLALAVHGQMSVTFSQYLNMAFEDGIRMFAWLMTVNAITVVASQPLLSRVGERKGPLTSIVLGAIALALGAIGFAHAPNFTALVVAMVIFTWGEVLLVPAEYAVLDGIAPETLRGVYYGAHSVSSLGNLLGPWIGGILLLHWGAPALFHTMGAVALLSMAVFVLGNRLSTQALPPAKPTLPAEGTG